LNKFADPEQQLGRSRQAFFGSHALEDSFEFRHEENQEYRHDDHTDAHDEDGISQRSERFAFKFLLLLDEPRDAFEGVLEKPPFAPSAGHIDSHVVEYFWVTGHRIGQRFAFFDLGFDLRDCVSERTARAALLREHREGFEHRYAASKQRGHLAIERGHLRTANAAGFPYLPGLVEFDRNRKQGLRPELHGCIPSARGRDATRDGLSGKISCDVGEIRHVKPRCLVAS